MHKTIGNFTARKLLPAFIALVALGVGVVAASAGVSPGTFEGTLAPGESATIDKTVDVPESTPKLDFFLIVDLSGSYNDDLPNIKALASDIVAGIRADVPDSNFGLGTFVDYPFSPWGSDAFGDYAYRLDQALTADETDWLAAVNAMAVAYGGDSPESQYSALYHAATGEGREMPISLDGDFDDLGEIAPTVTGWRADATKVIAITTDASFHNAGDAGPFPYPGPSRDDTVAALNAAGIRVIAMKAPGAGAQMDDIAAATGGSVVTTTSTSSDIVDAIIAGLAAITFDVTAVPVGCDPLTITFSPASHSGIAGGTSVGFTETIEVPAGLTEADVPGGVVTCTVEFRANDAVIGIQEITVEVPFNQPPDCTNASPSVSIIWPPNHKFVPVNVLGVTDADGDDVTVTIDSIWQDEPVNSVGDGDFAPDGQGVGTDTAEVRAERSGSPKTPGNGRVYHIGYTADDGNGGSCSGTVRVGVPHDMGKGKVPVDDGALYDSTVS